MDKTRFTTVDEYIAVQGAAARPGLKLLRQIIKKNAPEAEEIISYNMPAYKFHGMLAYFAAHTSHIGFYAMPGAVIAFKDKLRLYKTSKGTIQFPFTNPMPAKLITDMVQFRVKENLEKKALKEKIKKKK